MKKLIFVFALFLLFISSYFFYKQITFSSAQKPEPVITLINNSTGKELITEEVLPIEFYEVYFYNTEKLWVQKFDETGNDLQLKTTSEDNRSFAASLLDLQPTGSELQLPFNELPPTPVDKDYGRIAETKNKIHEYSFYQKSEVCADACIKTLSDVDIYYKSLAESGNDELRKLSTRLPFETPTFTNFSVFIYKNYLYVIHNPDKREKKDESIIPVYRAKIEENGHLASWEPLTSLPKIETNAYGVSQNIIINQNNIYIPYSNEQFYIGNIDANGHLRMKYLVNVPFYENLFVHNNELHFIRNSVVDDKRKVETTIGKVVLGKNNYNILYYPSTSTLINSVQSSFDSWNYYYEGKVYTLLQVGSFITGFKRRVLVIQNLR